MITGEENIGRMSNLLCVESTSAGTPNLAGWTTGRASKFGLHCASELTRRKDRNREYQSN
jgi:hypothetical protein